MLQCGHGSDAVETTAKHFAFRHYQALQCGHGSDAVETSLTVTSSPGSTCFNAATAVTPWRRDAGKPRARVLKASMRPRQ